MTDDLSFREHLMQRTQQEVQRDHLLCCAVVFVLRDREIFHFSLFLFTSGENDFVLPVSAFVAHAYRVSVIVLDVAAFDADGSAVVEGAVTGHVKVITGVLAEAFALVTCLELLNREVLTWLRVATVQHDQLNPPGIRRSLPIPAQPGQQFRS